MPKVSMKLSVNFFLYLLLCSMIGMLTACGTKGPLYIPEQRYPQGVEQPATPDKSDPNKKAEPIIPPIVTPPTVKDY